MSRSDVLIPLITSTSALAIDSYLFDGAYLSSTLGFSIGTLIPHAHESLRNKFKGKSVDQIKYSLNRQEERHIPIPANIYQDLEEKKSEANLGVIAGVVTGTLILPPILFMGVNPTPVLGVLFNRSVRDLSTKWRVKRVLDGDWSVDKEPPKEPVKVGALTPTMMPA